MRGKEKVVKTKPTWMVLFRHFGMEGGILDYGMASIEGFFFSFEEADKKAKEVYNFWKDISTFPTVWVLKCEKTYKKLDLEDGKSVNITVINEEGQKCGGGEKQEGD